MNIKFVYPCFEHIHINKDIGQMFVFLSDIGHQCEIITYLVPGNKTLECLESVRLTKFKSPFKRNFIYSPFNFQHFRIMEYVIKHRKNIDCLITVFNNMSIISFFYKLFNKSGISIIKMDTDGRLYQGKYRFFKRMIGELIFFILYKSIDLFIIETPEGRTELLTRHRYLNDKLIFIPNGINMKKYSDIVESILKKSGPIEYNNRIILYTGDVIPEKGVDILLNAFGKIANEFPCWKINIVGSLKDDKYKEYLYKIIREKNMINKINFTGRLSGEKLVSTYLNSEIFCFPSKRESFGLVIIEAMYFGKPVISSNVGVAKYALSEGSGFIFENNNEDKLVFFLKTLMIQKSLRRDIGIRASERCKLIFNYENIVKKLDNIITRLRKGEKIKQISRDVAFI